MREFFNSNFYSIVAAIALGIHLIINGKQLFVWRNARSHAGGLEFRHFLVCLTAFFVSDIMWGIFAGLEWRWLLYADTLLFFLTMALSVFAWTRFIATYLMMGGGSRRRMLWAGRLLLAFFAGALAVNALTGYFFTIDDRCVYSTGPLRQLSFLLLAVFNAYASAATLFWLPCKTGTLKRRYKMLFAVGIAMTAAILLQLGDPFLPLYSLGNLLGLCLMHVFVVEEIRGEMHKKEMLAHEYETRLDAERTANQAKSLFFSTVSHDIRTPLNAILGFSELLEQGVPDDGERARCIASIRSSGKVLARLVDDILDLSKIECGKLEIMEEPTNVPALVREVIAACEVARKRKSLALESEIAEMPWVSVDPQRMRQILFNLLSNAYKYTEKGKITVLVSWRDGTLGLSVSDTGKGISKENIHRILQPFVQVADRNHRDGTGLGLPICQRLAAIMGGELSVSSEVGVGSTFTVTLRNVRTVEPPDNRTERASRPQHAPSRVLIVDDVPVNRQVLKAMLEKCGVKEVATADNGTAALAALKDGPVFDMVLSDLWMPDMDGCELVRAIRADAKLSQVPVYLVTADVEAINQAESDGFTGILLKPVTLSGLQKLLA